MCHQHEQLNAEVTKTMWHLRGMMNRYGDSDAEINRFTSEHPHLLTIFNGLKRHWGDIERPPLRSKYLYDGIQDISQAWDEGQFLFKHPVAAFGLQTLLAMVYQHVLSDQGQVVGFLADHVTSASLQKALNRYDPKRINFDHDEDYVKCLVGLIYTVAQWMDDRTLQCRTPESDRLLTGFLVLNMKEVVQHNPAWDLSCG